LKKLLVLLLLLMLSVFAGTAYAQDESSSKENNDNQLVRAMWVWDYDLSVSTKENRNQLLQFSAHHDINLLFVNTNNVLQQHPKEFEALIKDAHKEGIRIYGLDGAANWALEANHHFALDSIQQVLDYNMAQPVKARFDGFQHDIEPYGMPDFWVDNNKQIFGSQYLDLLKKCEALVHQQVGMKFDVAIPFWYDSGVMVTYDGVEKPLSHHILDIVDSVSIMAYRNTAEGQISAAIKDINYAASVGKKAYISAETSQPDGDGIPAFITYYGTGIPYMEEQFKIIDDQMKNNPGYGGIAVEWYNAYLVMP
jgi:hypothetical protein